MQGPRSRHQLSSVATSAPETSLWPGSDEFTPLGDRVDAAPLLLPSISKPVRVVIVRHGQSTWNAEGRIQGSTDLSVLTDKGMKQAARTRDMLASVPFSAVFQSPLARARQTADIILQGRAGGSGAGGPERITLPSLREIDLYQFQGLLKHEGKAMYGEQYRRWQKAPHEFELDGHAPVRELWYRASLAWQSLLRHEGRRAEGGSSGAEGAEPSSAAAAAASSATSAAASASAGSADPRVVLVVAHNAINQALVATAMGLPPAYFRRLPQNNAALSVFDFEPGCGGGAEADRDGGGGGGGSTSPAHGGGPHAGRPRVTLTCYNQSPDNPFKNPDKVVAHVVLLTPPPPPPPPPQQQRPQAATHGPGAAGGSAADATDGEGDGDGDGGEALHSLSRVLGGLRFSHVLADASIAPATVQALLRGPPRSRHLAPASPASGSHTPASHDFPLASSEDQQWLTADGASQPQPNTQPLEAPAVEWLPAAANKGDAKAAWERAVALTTAAAAGGSSSGGGGGGLYGNVLVVLDERRHEAVLWAALGVPVAAGVAAGAGPAEGPRLRVSPGGLSVVEFTSDPSVAPAVVRCINNTAHMAAAAQQQEQEQ